MTINIVNQPLFIQNMTYWNNLTPKIPSVGPFSWTGSSGIQTTFITVLMPQNLHIQVVKF